MKKLEQAYTQIEPQMCSLTLSFITELLGEVPLNEYTCWPASKVVRLSVCACV